MKLYLKKLVFTILFFGLLLIISFALSLFHFVIPLETGTMYTVSMIIGTVIMLSFVYAIRLKNKKAKATYLSEKQPKKDSFEKEFYSVLKSKENIIHTIAFLTIINVISIWVSLSVQATILSAIEKMLILTLVGGIVFTLINTLISYLIHKHWRKEYKGKKKAG